MPTARELLEQADALMRRNRQEADRALRGPGQAPAPASGERGAPAARAQTGPLSIAPVIAPAAPAPAVPAIGPAIPSARAPLAVPAAPAPTAPAARAADDADIPVLDEAVSTTASAADAEDFPVLTDAVDEIEVAAPPVDEGEPSDWLMPPAEDESVLGPSPPSVAVVPPAWHQGAAASREVFVADFESALSAPPPSAPEIEDLSRATFAEFDPDVTVRRVLPALGVPVAPPKPVPPEIEDLAEESLADLDPDVTWTRPIRPPAPTEPAAATAAREPSGFEAREPVEDAPAATKPGLPAGADWDALAEEIRMQVLQRIDMFTDTGLRDRLGERLKPIVDRASADLVATINQHVGELLRAYVAEAIEREIDRWRSSH